MVNEAKATPHKEDLEKLESSISKFRTVLKTPEYFATDVAGLIDQLIGLEDVVPVMSGHYFEHSLQQLCHRMGIITVVRNGEGYTSSLSEGLHCF